MIKDKNKSNWDFRIMAFFFKVRDFFKSPREKVDKIELSPGDIVLDYGCGIGSYTIEAAQLVGSKGKVYAADIHPLAVKKVRKRAKKEDLKNIETILTDLHTSLGENSVDVVICFDVMHNIRHTTELIKEFHRVMKGSAILALADHHMEENEVVEIFSTRELFNLNKKKGDQYFFSPK
ncbi:MAG: class I SAM-dependent methyltransferase [Promethearchaeia archaeon]